MSAPAIPRPSSSTSPAPNHQPAALPGASAFSGVRRVPPPVNEPVRSYAPGSPERQALKERLASMSNERIEVPIVIGGEEIRTGELAQAVMPHAHQHVLADWHKASREHVIRAVDAAREAQREWANWSWEDRAAVFLRAARRLQRNSPRARGGERAGEELRTRLS